MTNVIQGSRKVFKGFEALRLNQKYVLTNEVSLKYIRLNLNCSMTNIFTTRSAFLVESLDLVNTSLGEALVDRELITSNQLDSVMVRT